MRVLARAFPKTPGAINRTESAYASRLELLRIAGEVSEWRYEAFTLKLADGVRYTPDFFVVLPSGYIELHEVKGFFRDDARVKLRVAARQFQCFRFLLVVKQGQQWEISEVEP